jgi:hypothetical protein
MRLTIVAPSFVMMTSPLADTIYGQRNEACVNTSFPWHATRLPHHFVHALGTQTGSHGVSNGPGGRDVALSDRPTASLLLFALHPRLSGQSLDQNRRSRPTSVGRRTSLETLADMFNTTKFRWRYGRKGLWRNRPVIAKSERAGRSGDSADPVQCWSDILNVSTLLSKSTCFCRKKRSVSLVQNRDVWIGAFVPCRPPGDECRRG